MKFLIVIFFFLLCISIVGPQHQYQTAFSFKLALQWPNSLCNGCRKTPRDFTIHGLWGFDQLGKRLPDCTRGKSLTLSDWPQVNDMRQQLEAAWPDLIRWNDPSFWSYEWSKHGSCLADMWPRKYFSTALVLRDRVGSLVDVLREGKESSKLLSDLCPTSPRRRPLSGPVYKGWYLTVPRGMILDSLLTLFRKNSK
ncbi:ribonuclease S-2-like isoform X3 [Actinidia eriantha]|uniref:ribonuclease S-2-like isoform X3 n=1 Tax=Actinidia eriantha TaxID=165200 RepID=UPI0025827294|nr:ribonuclease S-2-like isoform X3 [Actinidia eriantha]